MGDLLSQIFCICCVSLSITSIVCSMYSTSKREKERKIAVLDGFIAPLGIGIIGNYYNTYSTVAFGE